MKQKLKDDDVRYFKALGFNETIAKELADSVEHYFCGHCAISELEPIAIHHVNNLRLL